MGVTRKITKDGDERHFPSTGDEVTIHYTGMLMDGTVFDSSYDRGMPFKTEIGVGRVIRGWDEGVIQMSLGEKSRLNITSDYAYGARGFPNSIPPNSDIVFDVELIAINGRGAA